MGRLRKCVAVILSTLAGVTAILTVASVGPWSFGEKKGCIEFSPTKGNGIQFCYTVDSGPSSSCLFRLSGGWLDLLFYGVEESKRHIPEWEFQGWALDLTSFALVSHGCRRCPSPFPDPANRILMGRVFLPVLLLIFGAYPALVARKRIKLDRRRKHGLCLSCGYNLTGNVSGRCPECGNQIATT